MASIPHEVSENAFHARLLRDLRLTVEWVTAEGDLAVDQTFVDRHWYTLTPTDETRAKVVAYHVHILNLLRDLWSTSMVHPPYGSQHETMLPDSQILWSELNIPHFREPSCEELHTSLLELLGKDLYAVGTNDMQTVPRFDRPQDGIRLIYRPVSQIWVAVREMGFKSLNHPASGLLVNGEDQYYETDHLFSSLSGFAARFAETSVERTVKIFPFIVGCHATREAHDPLAGMRGLLRCINAQLVHQYHGKLGLTFLSDQYLCKILHNDFRALLYLFKHLLLAIGWTGCHTTLQHITLIIDGINHMEKPDQVEQWANFVRVLREIVFRIREIPDASSAYLARGLNFKYILVHPTVSDVDAHEYEIVVKRTDLPQTSERDLASRDLGSGSVWIGETRYNSTAHAVAAIDAGIASSSGSMHRSNGSAQDGNR